MCEDPVTNDTPAARVTVRVYKVFNENGDFQPGYDHEENGIPVGWSVTIDVVAKDEEGLETTGQGPIEFQFNKPQLVRVGGNHRYQRKLTVLKGGVLEVTATLDGVTSDPLVLYLGGG